MTRDMRVAIRTRPRLLLAAVAVAALCAAVLAVVAATSSAQRQGSITFDVVGQGSGDNKAITAEDVERELEPKSGNAQRRGQGYQRREPSRAGQ